MEAGIFDEYLVKLGFDSDPAGYAKFASTLSDAAGIAASRTKSIVEDLGKWQVAIVGGFAAIGTAAITVMDKVADADLGFQLLATKMYMGTDAAKSLSIATGVLGHTLDEIAWNPQLLSQFDTLISDQQRMAEVMGHGYEPALYNIREIKFQFERLQDTLEYGFLPQVISQIFNELGGGDVLEKLQKLNNWIIDNLPEITSAFSKGLVPVLKDAKTVLGDVVGMLESAGATYTNLVGVLSGDKSIEGTTFNFQNMVTAIDHTSHGFATFVGWITLAERMLLHVANAAVFTGEAIWDAFHGNLGAAHKDLSAAVSEWVAADNDLTPGSGTIAGGVIGTGVGAGTGAAAGGVIGGMVGSIVPVFGTAVGAAAGTAIGGAVGGVGGGSLGAGWGALTGWWKQKTDPSKSEHGYTIPATGIKGGSGSISDLLDEAAAKYHIDPLLLHAMANQESSGREYNSDGSVVLSKLTKSGYAKGVLQLEDATAKEMGVNPLDPASNIDGGAGYLAKMLAKYNGDQEEALAAYTWGQGKVDRLIKKHGGFDARYLPLDAQDYITRIEKGEQQAAIHITNNIHPSPSQSAAEIGKQVSDQTVAAIRANSRKQNTSNTAALGSPYQ